MDAIDQAPTISFPKIPHLVEKYEVADGYHFILKYGSKKMKIKFHEREGIIEEYLSSNKDAHLPEETTILFSTLNQFAQSLADQQKRKIIYHLVAQHPNIQTWVLTKGKEIFHWDNIRMNNENIPIYTQYYYPRKNLL